MAKGHRYKRYVPRYLPNQRWRQTACDSGWIMAYLRAAAQCRRTGLRTPVKGYGGWHVTPTNQDLE